MKDPKPPARLLETQRSLTAFLRDPESAEPPPGVEARRLAIYQRLFFNNLSNLFRRNFPVVRRLHSDDAWNAMIRDFMRHHRPHTPLFTEIGEEFIAYLEHTRVPQESDPAWLPQLAHWEYQETLARLDPADPNSVEFNQQANLLDELPIINPTLRLAHYQWPVHQIGPKFLPDQPAPCWLAVWRCRDDEVRFMKINALTARLIESLAAADENSTTATCLAGIAGELGQPEHKVLKAGGRLLDSLRQREVVLGVKPESGRSLGRIDQ